jgi:hypothetical protein
MGPSFIADYAKYGAFNIHYLPTNLYYQYLFYPLPPRPNTLMGGSLFLLSPLFFAAIPGFYKNRSQLSVRILLLTLLCVNLPILLLMGTGWVQFGPRYTLDFVVPLILLTAMGIRTWPKWVLLFLAAISIGHYVLGTVIFVI